MDEELDEPWEADIGPEHDPDLWQATLPQPFRMLDELLCEVIDDVLLEAGLREGKEAVVNAKPVPDSEDGARPLGPPNSCSLPPALPCHAGGLFAALSEDEFVVALPVPPAAKGLYIWSPSGSNDPQPLEGADASLVPAQLTCVALPASTGPPARTRLLLLATPGEQSEPVGDSLLLVLDLAPTTESSGWEAAELARFAVQTAPSVECQVPAPATHVQPPPLRPLPPSLPPALPDSRATLSSGNPPHAPTARHPRADRSSRPTAVSPPALFATAPSRSTTCRSRSARRRRRRRASRPSRLCSRRRRTAPSNRRSCARCPRPRARPRLARRTRTSTSPRCREGWARRSRGARSASWCGRRAGGRCAR